ncbi:MAG TPA: PfkB family carbohydrate kinase [Geobacteraceae bacterium]|nr:PfkB family carbohydrate kinase [Geobacteraceae bacterium]
MNADEKFDVVGLGVSTLDLLLVVAELPAGESVQRASESMLQGGGPVATALVALARLGSRTAMIDKLGDDWRGRLIIDGLRKEKVATEWIRTAAGRTSSIASILVRRRDGARAITFSPGTAGELDPDELPEDIIARATVLHMNGRHFDASLRAARLARARGVKVSFDGGADRYCDRIRELVAMTDICIVARPFACAYAGREDVAAAAGALLSGGPEIVVITSGAGGSDVFARDGEGFHQPAYKVKAVDTTGAGDAFHGAFLHGLVTGLDLKECADLAAAVAAMNTGKLGGRGALPTLAEARNFMGIRVGQ